MTDISKASEEDIKKFLEGKVKKSGFSLENEVEKILKKTYSVKREIPFFDMDESIGRNYDIKASKFFPDENKFDKKKLHAIAQYLLITECKNIPGNIWVFSEHESPPFSIPEHASMKNDKPPDPVFNISPDLPISGLHYCSGYSEFIFDESKTNKQTNNLYSGIMTVIKGVRQEKESYKKMFQTLQSWTPTTQTFILNFTYFQPVIIFTGKIFVTKYNEKDELVFESAKYLQIPKEYISKNYNEKAGEIHIVTYENLQDYLQKVGSFYRAKEKLIINNQKKLLSELKKIMPINP